MIAVLPEGESMEALPSPESLKRKIIIKGKVVKNGEVSGFPLPTLVPCLVLYRLSPTLPPFERTCSTPVTVYRLPPLPPLEGIVREVGSSHVRVTALEGTVILRSVALDLHVGVSWASLAALL